MPRLLLIDDDEQLAVTSKCPGNITRLCRDCLASKLLAGLVNNADIA